MTFGDQNTEAEAHEQLSYSWDHGINFLDTAEMYPVMPKAETQGRTDLYIGSWLKSQKREDIVLATKVAGRAERLSYLRDGGTMVTPSQIQESVDASLKRLGVDYVDLLQIHWPDRYVPMFGQQGYDRSKRREDFVPFEDQLEGMKAVVDQGKVRYIGVSNETSYGVMSFARAAEAASLPKIQTIQNCFHLMARMQYITDLDEVCLEQKVSLLAYSPLAGGALTGKYATGKATERSRFNFFTGYMARYMKSPAVRAVEEYMQVAEKHGLTPTQLALAWCQGHPGVTSTIIGATTMEQLKENIEAFETTLTPECSADIEEVLRRHVDPSLTEQ